MRPPPALVKVHVDADVARPRAGDQQVGVRHRPSAKGADTGARRIEKLVATLLEP